MVRSKKTGRDIGILLCNCHGELKKRLDFTWIEKELKTVDGVSDIKVHSDLCDPTVFSKAVFSLRKSGIDRIIISGCTSEDCMAQESDTRLKTGSDNSMLWFVNINEQCALVHADKRLATKKTLRRMRAAIERMKLAEPVMTVVRRVRQNAAVVGGGIAGLQAAVSLDKLGHEVSLFLKETKPGGTAASMPELFGHVTGDLNDDSGLLQRHINSLVQYVEISKKIHVYPGTQLRKVEGEQGDYLLEFSSDGKVDKIGIGAVVLATGSNRISALDSGDFKKTIKLIGLSDLLEKIRDGDIPNRIAIMMDMICEQDRTVSSKVLSSALILAKRFSSRVTIFCNNMRVAATGLESLYRTARNAGVIIVKSEMKPVIKPENANVNIVFDDPITSSIISEQFDLAVIADTCSPDNSRNRSGFDAMLKTGPEGELQYDNIWLLPIQTNRPGIYVIGGARGNSEYRDALTDGMAVAAEVHDLLKEKRIRIPEDSAIVDTGKCVLCLTCLRICPHGAVSIDPENKAASVSVVSCQRCGICVSECPSGAISMPGFTDEQIQADVGENPLVTVFACENSAIPAADTAGLNGCEYGDDVEIIKIPCAGRVDPKAVLGALEKGADRVLVIGCHPESCKYLSGSSRSEARMKLLKVMLEKVGIDSSRVTFGGIAAVEPLRFIEYVTTKSPGKPAEKTVES